MSPKNKQMYLEDDSVDATIIPEIFLVEVGVALHLDHARLVLVPTVNEKTNFLIKHWKYNCRNSLRESLVHKIAGGVFPMRKKNEKERHLWKNNC